MTCAPAATPTVARPLSAPTAAATMASSSSLARMALRAVWPPRTHSRCALASIRRPWRVDLAPARPWVTRRPALQRRQSDLDRAARDDRAGPDGGNRADRLAQGLDAAEAAARTRLQYPAASNGDLPAGGGGQQDVGQQAFGLGRDRHPLDR